MTTTAYPRTSHPTPINTNPTWAALQVWQGLNLGELVWWRLAIDGPHENDRYGIEMVDTNGQYRRCFVHQTDLRTLPNLRDEILKITGAPTWVMGRDDLFTWANKNEESDRFWLANGPREDT